MLRSEIRARSGMRASLSNIKHIVDRDISIHSNRSQNKTNSLKIPHNTTTTTVTGGDGFIVRSEHMHLRGFLPIAEYIEMVSLNITK